MRTGSRWANWNWTVPFGWGYIPGDAQLIGPFPAQGAPAGTIKLWCEASQRPAVV